MRHVGLKFLEKAPGYVAPPPKEKPREPTPGLQKNKKRGRRSKSQGSDRGSSYGASGSEAESPHRNRRRHRSNRVKVVEEDQGNPPIKGAGPSNSDSLPLSEPSQNKNRLFVNCIRVMEKDDGAVEEVCCKGLANLFDCMEYSKLSNFQLRVNRVLKVGRINKVAREPIMKGGFLVVP